MTMIQHINTTMHCKPKAHPKQKNNPYKNNSYYKGLAIEKIAAQYLQSQGFTLLQQNFHCPYGEIDLIAKNSTDLVFVEVRYRKNQEYGHPAETITFFKQQKVILAAQYYLAKNDWASTLPCRIDVIALTGKLNSKINGVNIEWIQNAICI